MQEPNQMERNSRRPNICHVSDDKGALITILRTGILR